MAGPRRKGRGPLLSAEGLPARNVPAPEGKLSGDRPLSHSLTWSDSLTNCSRPWGRRGGASRLLGKNSSRGLGESVFRISGKRGRLFSA